MVSVWPHFERKLICMVDMAKWQTWHSNYYDRKWHPGRSDGRLPVKVASFPGKVSGRKRRRRDEMSEWERKDREERKGFNMTIAPQENGAKLDPCTLGPVIAFLGQGHASSATHYTHSPTIVLVQKWSRDRLGHDNWSWHVAVCFQHILSRSVRKSIDSLDVLTQSETPNDPRPTLCCIKQDPSKSRSKKLRLLRLAKQSQLQAPHQSQGLDIIRW